MITTTLIIAASLSVFIGLRLTLPWLKSKAIAKVTDRSMHEGLVPQGAGIIIFPCMLFVFLIYYLIYQTPTLLLQILILANLMAIIGFLDDLYGLKVSHRFLLQGVICAITLWLILPTSWYYFAPIMLLALMWNVNLTNFMDGIDLMSVTHGISISLAMIFAFTIGHLPVWGLILSALLLGGMIGFLPLNFPKAKLFMGDAGSLPLGLITGVLLIAYAERTGIIPALILSLYYFMDTGITILMRLKRGENIFTAHKSHFYQKQVQNGEAVIWVILGIVFMNALLAYTAYLIVKSDLYNQIIVFASAVFFVSCHLWSIERKFKTKPL